jgi:hypothetical protein
MPSRFWVNTLIRQHRDYCHHLVLPGGDGLAAVATAAGLLRVL